MALLTFVGWGSWVAANNAAVTASLPAGIQSGDTIFCFGLAREDLATLSITSGWTERRTYYGTPNVESRTSIWSRTYDGSFSNVTVTPSNTGANDTVLAVCFAIRGTVGTYTTGSAEVIMGGGGTNRISIRPRYEAVTAGDLIIWSVGGDDDLYTDTVPWYSKTAGTNDMSMGWAEYSIGSSALGADAMAVVGVGRVGEGLDMSTAYFDIETIAQYNGGYANTMWFIVNGEAPPTAAALASSATCVATATATGMVGNGLGAVSSCTVTASATLTDVPMLAAYVGRGSGVSGARATVELYDRTRGGTVGTILWIMHGHAGFVAMRGSYPYYHYTSKDGVTWDAPFWVQVGSESDFTFWRAKSYMFGKYLLATFSSSGEHYAYSEDGKKYTQTLVPGGSYQPTRMWPCGDLAIITTQDTTTIKTSSNGIEWSSATVHATAFLPIFAGKAGSTYVIFSSGYCYSSTDGTNWTRTALPFTALSAAVMGNTAYAFTASQMSSSTDGVNWSAAVSMSRSIQPNPIGIDGRLIYGYSTGTGPTYYVVASSTDGITWVDDQITSLSTFNYHAGDYYTPMHGGGAACTVTADGTPGHYVALITQHSASGTLTFSSGASGAAFGQCGGGNLLGASLVRGYTKKISGYEAGFDIQKIAYGNGVFVAIAGNSENNVLVSSDGLNWEVSSYLWHDFGGSYAAVGDVIFAGGTFILLVYDTNKSATSTNGREWTIRTNMPASDRWDNLGYDGTGRVVATCWVSASAAYSDDYGVTWSSATTAGGVGWNGIAYGSGKFVMANYGNIDTTNSYMISTNGSTWTYETLPVLTRCLDVTFSDGYFYMLSLSAIYRSQTGLTGSWTTCTIPGMSGSQFKKIYAVLGYVMATLDNYPPVVSLGGSVFESMRIQTPSPTTNWRHAAADSARNIGVLLGSNAYPSDNPQALFHKTTNGVIAHLTTDIKLASAQTIQVTATAFLTMPINFAAAATVVVTATAEFGGGALMAAAESCLATSTGALTAQIKLASAASNVCSTTAALTAVIRLAASATAEATPTATLIIPIDLGANEAGVVVANAALTAQIRLAGALAGAAAASGALDLFRKLDAEASGVANASGVLSAQIRLAASGVCDLATAAELLTKIQLEAHAEAFASTFARLAYLPEGAAFSIAGTEEPIVTSIMGEDVYVS